MRKVRIGVLGCGTVGGGFVRLLERNRSNIRQRQGVDLAVSRILIKDPAKDRHEVDRSLLTENSDEVIDGCDIVVELIGGTSHARAMIRDAITLRRNVVTANKALLALAGRDLLDLASVHRVRLEFEASVCGAIPIIRVLRSITAGDRVRSISGILNGTCNYILTRMAEQRIPFDQALAGARELGLAEADASLDVDGLDAAQKLTILSEIAFGHESSPAAVEVEGIRKVTLDDIERAKSRGCVIRQIARATLEGSQVHLRVGPEEIPRAHHFTAARAQQNVVSVEAEAAGPITLFGAGAGALPSASAVLADVVELAR